VFKVLPEVGCFMGSISGLTSGFNVKESVRRRSTGRCVMQVGLVLDRGGHGDGCLGERGINTEYCNS
jgi:hypothetical protein